MTPKKTRARITRSIAQQIGNMTQEITIPESAAQKLVDNGKVELEDDVRGHDVVLKLEEDK